MDIAADTGTVIRAAGPGVVKFSGDSGGNYGLLIIIQHAEGFSTRYAHCHQTRCQAGRRVQAGDVIVEFDGNEIDVTGPFYAHFTSKIASGTNDIQRNIIAERGLGLPREPRVRFDHGRWELIQVASNKGGN